MDQMTTLLTPDEYVQQQIVQFPTIFAYASYEKSKFAVFDQLFNVIGTGINTRDDLIRDLTPNTNIDRAQYVAYINTPLWHGYFEVRELTLGARTLVVPASSETVICLESEKHTHPGVKHWHRCSINGKHAWDPEPYPCFDPKYSLVWTVGIAELGDAWIDAAIWFYEQSRQWLSEYEPHYAYAYPAATLKATANRTADMAGRLDGLTHQQVMEQWQHPYDGNVEEFLKGRWDREKARIFAFISSTIDLLRNIRAYPGETAV